MDKINVCDDSFETNVCDIPEITPLSDADFKKAISIASECIFRNDDDKKFLTAKYRKTDPIDRPLSCLFLSVETHTALRWADFYTIGDLVRDLENPESRIRNFEINRISQKQFVEIISVLKKYKFNMRNICTHCRKFLTVDDKKTKICNDCYEKTKQ